MSEGQIEYEWAALRQGARVLAVRYYPDEQEARDWCARPPQASRGWYVGRRALGPWLKAEDPAPDIRQRAALVGIELTEDIQEQCTLVPCTLPDGTKTMGYGPKERVHQFSTEWMPLDAS